MSRVRQFLFLAALGAGATGCRSVGPSEVLLPDKLDARLQSNAQACVERLNRDRERAQNAMNLSDVLVLLGASAGAAGSIAAAFLTKTSVRRASAVVGAVGALTAGAPKTLDDPADILTRRSRAERHWVVGYKVLTQTTIASAPAGLAAQSLQVAELTGESAKVAVEASSQQRQKALIYVLDRFIDCTADQPPENFEELPSSGFFTVGTPVASARTLNDPVGIAATEGESTVRLYAEPPAAAGRTLPEDKEAGAPNPP
ncbi:hypothetical protein [Hyalangium sp.]|uniref:hypothetical protein n=1 Tax=Hyalangium sp. TaxID=2028555 RepID=UPI002D6D0F43|nr:hypothetical protein [Hyalangium sp.]HYI02167.1 hypothetical protein [Hyalangium sp.]